MLRQKGSINIIIMYSQMTVGKSYSISTGYDVNNPNNSNKATQQCSKFIVVLWFVLVKVWVTGMSLIVVFIENEFNQSV